MPYFDLHCHPTFKYSLINKASQQATPIEAVVQIRFNGLLASLRTLIMWVFGEPLDSQSAISQLFDGGTNLISLTIYALENAYTRSPIISQLGCISNTLDGVKIDAIRKGTIGYSSLAQEQINTLIDLSQRNAPVGPGGRRLKLISDFAEYNPADTGTLHVILNFEGGHCFYRGQTNDVSTEVINTLVSQKRSPVRPLYITLVHHAQNVLANHAFAVPTQWARAGTTVNIGSGLVGGFNPEGDGITPLGLTFIDEALSTRNGPPIYIDVKHMSLGSRIAYYELRKQRYPHIPIIASHMGVTGLSWNDTHTKGQPIVRWVRRQATHIDVKYNNIISYPQTLPQPSPINPQTAPTSVVTFNPWSINLYDEDITEILASDGLIGLSLDIRILGMGNDRPVAHEHEAERLSLNEQLFSVDDHARNGQDDFDHLPDTSIQASLAHVEYLCNNLLHIVKVGRKTIGDRVWDHICIGSDFDGLIVSIEYQNNRRTKANNVPELRATLKETLPKVAQKMGVPLIIDGTAPDVFLERVLDKFFMTNGLRFLKTYFSRLTPASPPA